jgi:hypothetical protein
VAERGERGNRIAYTTCDRCERRDVAPFWVTDDIWMKVVGTPVGRFCMTCFDELADEKDVQYTFLAISPVTWSQGAYGEWPHLDVPCAECVGRMERELHWKRRTEGECPTS